MPSCTLSLKDIGGCAPLKHGRTRKKIKKEIVLRLRKQRSQQKRKFEGMQNASFVAGLEGNQTLSTEVSEWGLGDRIQLLNLTL